MNIAEKHKMVNMGVNTNDSASHLYYPSEAIDLYLNNTIKSYALSLINSDRIGNRNVVDYKTISLPSNILYPILKHNLLSAYQCDDKSYYANLPSNLYDNISSGSLISGNKYLIVTSGSTSLSSFGTEVTTAGTQFTCSIDDVTPSSTPSSTSFFSIDVVEGTKYKISILGSADFTSVGAPDNEVGTIFTATRTATISCNATTKLNVLEDTPSWSGGTTLRIMENEYLFYFIYSDSIIQGQNTITSGTLEFGKYYKVKTAGSTNLYDSGYNKNTNVVGDLFKCTSEQTPTWDGITELYVEEVIENGLIVTTDSKNVLKNSYSSSKCRILTEMLDNKLILYTNDHIIDAVLIKYLSYPDIVSKDLNVDCNLPNFVHEDIVNLTIQKILKNEVRKNTIE